MRARKDKRRVVPEWLDEVVPEQNSFGQAMQGRGDSGTIPFIAGVTDGGQDDVARLEYLMWQMKSPQQRFAASALGKEIGASPLGDPQGDRGIGRWAGRNDYWGGLARNVVGGGDVPRARLSNVAGIEGDALPGWQDAVARYAREHGLTIADVLQQMRGGR